MRRWAPSALWSALILTATSIPGSMFRAAPVVRGADKVVHALLYGTLAWFLSRATRGEPDGWTTRFTWILAGIALFAAADEWHQQFIPGRSMDIADWAADVAGAAAALLISRTAQMRRGPVS